MIRYSLACDSRHEFESWFQNSADLRQAGEARPGGLPGLRLGEGREGLMAPSLAAAPTRAPIAPAHDAERRAAASAGRKRRPVAMMSPQEHEFRKKLKELRDHLTKNADNVGEKFPEEARKMHYGEIEHRSIYGEASPKEAEGAARRRHRVSSAAGAAGRAQLAA